METARDFLPPEPLVWSNLMGLLWLGMVMAAMFYNGRFPIPKGYLQRHGASYFLNFNLPFVVVKTVDILFQQLFLMVLVVWLYRYWGDILMVSVLVAAVFVVAHVPLLMVQKRVSLLHFIGAMLFVGIVPWVILEVEGGFWLLCLGHWAFYVVIRVLMGYRALRQSTLGADIRLEG